MTESSVTAAFAPLGALSCNEPMARHTTFGVGGPAQLYLKVTSRDLLVAAVKVAARLTLPYFILGSGSNILVGDRGLRGIVIENNARSIDGPQSLATGHVRFRADSGVNFASLGRRMCREGYAGLEWAIGIPGTLGGAVVYNAGAYGGCLADVLESIDVVTDNGRVETMSAAALSLRYRSSHFTRGLFQGQVIVSVDFHVRAGDRLRLQEHVAALDVKRKAAQPPGRNAGSVFKNPDGKPAWWYIDQVGLRGARAGGAQISPKHANFFMNVDGARAADVKALMDEAIRRVRDCFGIELEQEIALVGDGFCPAGVAICTDAQ